ncbi:hypothetical protein [Bacillus cereus]|uniref:hypothetical protein n=1 Tax=Bacillus cereus TaxID=1396 RepID=UPI003D995E65
MKLTEFRVVVDGDFSQEELSEVISTALFENYKGKWNVLGVKSLGEFTEEITVLKEDKLK